MAGVGAGGSEDPKPLLVRGGDALRALISRTPRCRLRPTAFFVSWQGVITLAYRWHPTLKTLQGLFSWQGVITLAYRCGMLETL